MNTTASLINQHNFPYCLPELPYPIDGLEPHMSAKLMDYHYNKHHRTYVDKLNGLVKDTDYQGLSLEEIMLKVDEPKGIEMIIYNNAAQIWNHTFFWHCMSPSGGGKPVKLLPLLEEEFGSFDAFIEEFTTTALGLFGSGWVWLVRSEDGKIQITKTSNAGNPLLAKQKPLLTLDVWEHAYYIDHYNKRKDYIDMFFNKLVNWQFVDNNLIDD